MSTQVYKLYLNSAISKMGAGQQKRADPGPQLSGGPEAGQFDPRVRQPQGAEQHC